MSLINIRFNRHCGWRNLQRPCSSVNKDGGICKVGGISREFRGDVKTVKTQRAQEKC